LSHGNVAREQRWKDRGKQRGFPWRSPFAGRVAAASTFVDPFGDGPVWCEANGHRSIPGSSVVSIGA